MSEVPFPREGLKRPPLLLPTYDLIYIIRSVSPLHWGMIPANGGSI